MILVIVLKFKGAAGCILFIPFITAVMPYYLY